METITRIQNTCSASDCPRGRVSRKAMETHSSLLEGILQNGLVREDALAERQWRRNHAAWLNELRPYRVREDALAERQWRLPDPHPDQCRNPRSERTR